MFLKKQKKKNHKTKLKQENGKKRKNWKDGG